MKKSADKKPINSRELMLKITMITGALIWFFTVILRQTAIVQYGAIGTILGVTPNFGAVWQSFGVVYFLFPVLMKRQFHQRYSGPLLLIILMLLMVSEIFHDLYLNSPFDVWDMAASIIAAAILWAAIVLTKQED